MTPVEEFAWPYHSSLSGHRLLLWQLGLLPPPVAPTITPQAASPSQPPPSCQSISMVESGDEAPRGH
ncbi:hypothetical protein E2562_030556 [Oryza meyeriana var. granulata]|uniref:Uncharacterized protein n=1 Tax=Oryza meyeriana var. granulata TaxID=110450 RepID=A0A6G1D9B6_9ORYZ|nr:hypothetical protein E2562_030556 [Oryza meyeriana var. granulata]